MRPVGGEPLSGPVWFVGDLQDPCVAAIADSLEAAARPVRVGCAGELPDGPFDRPDAPSVVVLHRGVLTRSDAERLARLRSSRIPAPLVILCYGPNVRYVDLERWGPLVDAAVPEATARESVVRLAAGRLPEAARALSRGQVPARRPGVTVVSGNGALRQMLTEAIEAAGYTAFEARDWAAAARPGPAVWDVPVLEPGWPESLEERASSGPVVALIGLADRALVATACEHGAAACLDLPVDLTDLVRVLDRVTRRPARARGEPAHPTPPAPMGALHGVASGSPRVAGGERPA